MKKYYLKSRYCFRADTLENWIAHNPILENGEPSIVSNPTNESEYIKFGDGVTAWVDLPYKNGPRGYSGVYIGTGEMPDDCNLQIDPEGEVLTIEQLIERVAAQVNKLSTVTLLADKWEGTESPYTQVVDIVGTTKNSKINLNPTIEQLNIFHNKDISFVVGNTNGIITVYCIGQKPTNDYTMQVSITEVNVI